MLTGFSGHFWEISDEDEEPELPFSFDVRKKKNPVYFQGSKQFKIKNETDKDEYLSQGNSRLSLNSNLLFNKTSSSTWTKVHDMLSSLPHITHNLLTADILLTSSPGCFHVFFAAWLHAVNRQRW